MKTKHLLVLLVFFALAGCVEKKSMEGKWIEKDNFINPEIWELSQDSFRILPRDYYKRYYKIKNDTFFYATIDGLGKSRFEIENNEIHFFSDVKDSITYVLEKYPYDNFIEYFNEKKSINVKLPELESSNIGFSHQSTSTIVIENSANNEFYLNGRKEKLDSLLHLRLFEIHRIRLCVYCDKDIELSYLNKLKHELQKARVQRIIYITQDSLGKLYSHSFKQKIIESNIPDTIKPKHPFPPPAKFPKIEDFNSDDLHCKVNEQSIELNGKTLSKKEFKKVLIEKIKEETRSILFVNFDESMTYEIYLKKLNEIISIYKDVRNEYSMKIYQVKDFENLEHEERKEIRKLVPISVWEINKNEYEKIKKNAL